MIALAPPLPPGGFPQERNKATTLFEILPRLKSWEYFNINPGVSYSCSGAYPSQEILRLNRL